MRFLILLLAVFLGTVAGAPETASRIVGGNTTTIASFPEIASLLHRYYLLWWQHTCGGTIITSRAILTAAQCPGGDGANKWRVRVGSTYSNKGGTVYQISSIVKHPRYNANYHTNDIAIMRTSSLISFGSLVNAATIPGASFPLRDNSTLTAAGWGATRSGGSSVSELRRVQIWSVNQTACVRRYETLGAVVTDSMMCDGWLGVGGRGTCDKDTGGPIYYGRVVVGIVSWGYQSQCALPEYPGVNTRVSSFTTWIQVTA